MSVFLLIIIIIGSFIVLLVQTIKLREKVNNIEWRILPLDKLTDRLRELEKKIENLKIPEGISREKVEPAQPPHIPTSDQSVVKKPESVSQPELKETHTPISEFNMPKSRTREEWESFIGGKLLNRIGALALIIGSGFFLKYAFDNNWISETVRVLIGAAAGILCLLLAYRANRKGFQIFAQGLVGSGIAILYLSVYASFNFYELVPQQAAFALMSLVTILSLAIGLYYNSLSVGVLGWAGGFLTPIMLSTGVVNETGLFTYIALLDVGLLAVVFAKKEWKIIEPLTLAGTWLMYFAWHISHYHESDLVITVFFISVFWALFFGLDSARLRLTKITDIKMQHVSAAINLVLYYCTLYILINHEHHSWMGGATAFIAFIYIGTFLWLKNSGMTVNIVIIRYTLSAIALAVIATSIQFEDFTTIDLWSIEAASLIWCGVYWRKRFSIIAAASLFSIAILKFIYTNGAFSFEPIEQFSIILNQRCLTLTIMGLAFAGSARLIKDEWVNSKGLNSFFNSLWCITLFTIITVETNDLFQLKMIGQPAITFEYLSFLRPLILGVLWCALSLPLVWIALKDKIIPVLFSGLSILALSTGFIIIRGLEFEPIADYHFIINLRTTFIIFAIGGIFIHQRIISQYREVVSWSANISRALQIGIVALILVLITGETIDIFEKQIFITQATGSELWHLNNLRQLSLSGVWLFYSAALMVFGFWRSLRSFRIIAFVFFGFTIIKIFVFDLSYLETLYRIFSFIGLGVILIAVSFVYQKYKDVIFMGNNNSA